MYSAKKRNYTGVIRPIRDENGNVIDRVFRKRKIYDGPLKRINLENKINSEI